MPKRRAINACTASRVQSANGSLSWSGHWSLISRLSAVACAGRRRSCSPGRRPRFLGASAAAPPARQAWSQRPMVLWCRPSIRAAARREVPAVTMATARPRSTARASPETRRPSSLSIPHI
jgi:hypothetical protein